MFQTDFWAPPRRVGRDVSIMIPPSHVDDVTSQLRNAGIKVRFKTRNVQKSVTFLPSSLLAQLHSVVPSSRRRHRLEKTVLSVFSVSAV